MSGGPEQGGEGPVLGARLTAFSPLPRVAFLGLGTMGAPMAAHLARAGCALTVWNRSGDKARAFAATHNGVQVATTPREAAAAADMVITMLADPGAVEQVVLGAPEAPEQGALAGLAPGATLVEMSTVDPVTSRAIHSRVAGRGGRFLDVPVVGSRRPAEAGTLLLLAGGASDDLERVRAVLEPMGRILAVGPVGAGSALKLVCNSLGAHMLVGLASSLVMARAAGIDPALALEAIQRSAFAAPGHAAKGARILDGDFANPDFTLRLMKKDQALALATAEAAGLSLPSLAGIVEVIDRALALGHGEDDLSAVVRGVERDGLLARRSTER